MLESPAAAEHLAACDVAAVVFDSSELHSFHTAHRLLLRIAQAAGDTLPCVLIAAKDDLGMEPVRLLDSQNRGGRPCILGAQGPSL